MPCDCSSGGSSTIGCYGWVQSSSISIVLGALAVKLSLSLAVTETIGCVLEVVFSMILRIDGPGCCSRCSMLGTSMDIESGTAVTLFSKPVIANTRSSLSSMAWNLPTPPPVMLCCFLFSVSFLLVLYFF